MKIKNKGEEIYFLLVEDDEVDIMNLKRAFKKNEIENPVIIANNGVEALEILRNPETIPLPKIILLDINMPKMNGIEFLQEIRKDTILRSLTVFIMTTSNSDRDKFEAYDLNVAGYVIKPLSFDAFVEKVKNLSNYWSTIEFS